MNPLRAEDARLVRHFDLAERHVRRRPDALLSAARKAKRARTLDAVRDYRERGRFPRNRDLAEQTPFFIDEAGTRCGMAYLLESVGAVELVQRIARSANNARILELAGDAELHHWLDVLGLDPDEAARIQPSYCSPLKSACVCAGWGSESGTQVVTATILAGDAGRASARVESLLGGVPLTAPGDALVLDDWSADPVVAASDQLVAVRRLDDDAGTLVAWRVPLAHLNFVTCGDPPFGIPISRDEVVSALLAPDCAAWLSAKDPRYDEHVCNVPSAQPKAVAATDGSNGCAYASFTGASSLPFVFALVAGAAAVRRPDRARRR